MRTPVAANAPGGRLGVRAPRGARGVAGARGSRGRGTARVRGRSLPRAGTRRRRARGPARGGAPVRPTSTRTPTVSPTRLRRPPLRRRVRARRLSPRRPEPDARTCPRRPGRACSSTGRADARRPRTISRARSSGPTSSSCARSSVPPDRVHRQGACPFCGGAPWVGARREGSLMEGATPDARLRAVRRRVALRPHPLPVLSRAESRAGSRRSRSERHPTVRIEACETCHRYVKSIDLSEDARPIPEVDDLVSLAMDLWAREQGFERIEPGIAGL